MLFFNLKKFTLKEIDEFYKKNGLGFTVKDGKIRGFIKERV